MPDLSPDLSPPDLYPPDLYVAEYFAVLVVKQIETLLVFLFFQRQIVAGLTAGAVKK
ncbi:MAG: hypothetical protein IH935_11090 [Acidobacteria bacterium]|nr:hypothetical protein [Acidobacteriota bacterium]